jgi:uncharacterized protein (DUF697 family)
MSDQAIAQAPTDVQLRIESANGIVKRNALWAAGAGVLPFPLVEFAAITIVEVKLIHELADHYQTPFSEDLAKSAVISLLGSLGSVTLGKWVAISSLRFIPLLGPVLAVAAVPAIAAAITYAIGKVFITHFESGGSLLDFDPVKMREFFRREFTSQMSPSSAAAATAAAAKSRPATA